MSDYLNTAIPGLSIFARVATQAIIDPGFRPRQFHVFSVLAAHAGKTGIVRVSQARVAEMCGFQSGGQPDSALVSRLISNPGYAKQKSGFGPGLVELGYLAKSGRTGYNQIKQYKLFIPFVNADGFVTRPGGELVKLRLPTDRYDKDYVQKKKDEVDNIEAVEEAKKSSRLQPIADINEDEDDEERRRASHLESAESEFAAQSSGVAPVSDSYPDEYDDESESEIPAPT